MNKDLNHWREAFLADMESIHCFEALFDRMPDTLYAIKDRNGRYVSISETVVQRCGIRRKQDAIGKTAFDLYPRPMAERYARQDERLFRTGRPIVDNLDLTVYRNGGAGWCLSTKEPIYNRQRRLVGLAAISKDLVEPSRAGYIDARFAQTVDYMHEHYLEPLRMEDLAQMAGLSLAQFERRMKKIFHMPAGRYLIKSRIDNAARLLSASDMPIAEIAQRSGFSDQSSLSRQFRQITGFTPRQYRSLARPQDELDARR